MLADSSDLENTTIARESSEAPPAIPEAQTVRNNYKRDEFLTYILDYWTTHFRLSQVMDGNRLVNDVGPDFIDPYLSLFDGDWPVNKTWAGVILEYAVRLKPKAYLSFQTRQYTLSEMGPYIASLCGHVRPLQDAANRLLTFPYISPRKCKCGECRKFSSIEGIAEQLIAWATMEGCEVVLRYLLDTYPHLLPHCGRLLRDICDDEEPDLIIVSVLLEKGAPPNEPSSFLNDAYSMPLHAALLSSSLTGMQLDLVELLIRNGADVNAVTPRRSISTIHCVAMRRRINFVQLVDMLLRYGANIDAKDSRGNSPLVEMCRGSLESVFIPIHHGIREFIRQGADAHLSGHNGYTALHYVSSRGMLPSVRELLNSGVPAECRTACGRTPLHLSCMTFMMYLKDGASYGGWNNSFLKLFWYERADRHYQLSELVSDNISSDQTKGERGSTHSSVGRLEEDQGPDNDTQPHEQVEVDQHSERGTVRDPAMESARIADPATARESSGRSSQRSLDSGHISTRASSLQVRVQQTLHFQGSQESLSEYVIAGRQIYSPERADVIELLVDVGADPDSRDAELCTPLHYVALAGDLFLVELLIRRLGADPTAQDGHGRTALHFVCCGFQYGSYWVSPDEAEEIIALRRGIIGLLIDCGVDTNITDQDGKTALDYARLHKDNISEFLEIRTARHVPGNQTQAMPRTDGNKHMTAEQLKRDIMWKPMAQEHS
ncbi:ankyrin repeat-containing domain protein [Xylaria curta]|nr:ankyrin repeat-containing domain protein [Xylaria curta]